MRITSAISPVIISRIRRGSSITCSAPQYEDGCLISGRSVCVDAIVHTLPEVQVCQGAVDDTTDRPQVGEIGGSRYQSECPNGESHRGGVLTREAQQQPCENVATLGRQVA